MADQTASGGNGIRRADSDRPQVRASLLPTIASICLEPGAVFQLQQNAELFFRRAMRIPEEHFSPPAKLRKEARHFHQDSNAVASEPQPQPEQIFCETQF